MLRDFLADLIGVPRIKLASRLCHQHEGHVFVTRKSLAIRMHQLPPARVVLEFAADGEDRFVSRAVVKLELGLPWKPVLAWVWGVAYEINPATGRVCRHLESWEVSAAEGVSQLFRQGKGLRGGRSSS